MIMKNSDKPFQGKTALQVLLVSVTTVLLMLVMTGFNSHHFLVDDNLNQFYPIIRKSFDQFCRTGHFPVYDFFQQRGMIIADEGYYGQTNFLLFVSYLLEKWIHISDCMNIYAVLCTVIGNAGLFCLFRKLGISVFSSVSAIFMLTTSSCFFNYGYWYYIFNNYAVLPYLLLGLYLITKEEGRLIPYIFSGIVLAFSSTLGNLQYTLYHYMAFAVASVSYIIISGNHAKIKCLASNVCLAVFLTSPILLIALKASERRSEFADGEFFSLPVKPGLQLILSVIPYPWFRRFVSGYAPNGQMSGFSFLYTGFLLPCSVSFLLYLFHAVFSASVKRCILNACSKLRTMPAAYAFLSLLLYLLFLSLSGSVVLSLVSVFLLCLVLVAYQGIRAGDAASLPSGNGCTGFLVSILICIVFFVLLEAGRGFVIADIISRVPVVRQFRYLFKISFVMPFFMALISAYMLDILKFRAKRVLSVFFILLGLCNNFSAHNNHNFYNAFHRNSSRKIFSYGTLRKEMEAKGVNLNDYRILPFLSSTSTNIWGEYFDTKMLASNLPSLFGYYSLGGYEQAAISRGYAASERLLIDDNFHYRRQASVPCQQFFNSCRDSGRYAHDAAVQMQKGAVKYCLFASDSPFIGDFRDFIGNSGILSVIRTIPLSNDTVLFELGGDIAVLFDGCTLIGRDRLDRIEFDCRQTGPVTSSFLYDPKLKAWSVRNGRKHEYQVSSNEYGNAVIDIDCIPEDRMVHLQYVGTKKSFVLRGGFILSALALILIIAVCIHSCNVGMIE